MADSTFLSSITNSIKRIGQENNQFKTAATQQNSSISRFIRDISKLFGSQSKQQSDINGALGDIQQTSVVTSTKVDQTNNLLQESISIQSSMLAELKSVSSTLSGLLNNSKQQTDGSFLDSFKTFAGGKGLVSGVLGGANILSGDLSSFTGGLGGNNASVSGAGSSGSSSEALKFFESKGWTKEQAAGIVGNLQAESGKDLNPDLPGDGGKAFGIAQWHPDRQSNFEKQFGKGLSQSSFQEQLQFIQWELENTEKQAADALKNTKTAAEAATIIDALYERSSGEHRQKRIANAESLLEKDDSMAPAGTVMEKASPTSKVGVSEQQSSLAGIRKHPISPKLKTVLDSASAGGQPTKGSGGARTGSTRHDNGNAADLRLYKDGRKLVDTNPEDRAIMAKFVSAAVAAGATGVGAGHNYMGPDSIHVGFGKQATWGGAPWIQAAASGIYNNQDTSSEGTANYTQSGGEAASGGALDSISSSFGDLIKGTPLEQFSGLSSQLFGALRIMSGGLPAFAGMLGGSGNAQTNKGFGGTNIVENILGPSIGSPLPIKNDIFSKNDTENSTYKGQDFTEGDDLISLLKQQKEPVAAQNIQTAAINNDISKFTVPQQGTNIQQQNIDQPSFNNPDKQRTSVSSPSSYSSSPSWYLQLAGRISNDETMKFIGGVFT